ncbi:MAG: S8 family serine peptidase, partial [Thermaceae bacterium]
MKRLLLLTLSLGGLLMACNQTTQVNPGQKVSRPALAQSEGLTYFGTEVVVAYEDEVALQNAIQTLKAKEVARIPELKAALLVVPKDALKASRLLKGLPGLRYAEPHLAMVQAPKDDPVEARRKGRESLLSNPVPLGNPSDQVFDELPQYALDPRHLDAKGAWSRGFMGEGVVVAIIDDPADVTHPDLAPNWAGMAYDPVTDTTYTTAQGWLGFIQTL